MFQPDDKNDEGPVARLTECPLSSLGRTELCTDIEARVHGCLGFEPSAFSRQPFLLMKEPEQGRVAPDRWPAERLNRVP